MFTVTILAQDLVTSSVDFITHLNDAKMFISQGLEHATYFIISMLFSSKKIPSLVNHSPNDAYQNYVLLGNPISNSTCSMRLFINYVNPK